MQLPKKKLEIMIEQLKKDYENDEKSLNDKQKRLEQDLKRYTEDDDRKKN